MSRPHLVGRGSKINLVRDESRADVIRGESRVKQCQGIEPILSQRSLGPILKGRILRLSLSGRSLEPTWKRGIKSSRCQGGAQGPPYQEESRASLSESSLAGWSLRLILYKRSLQGPPCQGHKRKEIRSQDHMRDCQNAPCKRENSSGFGSSSSSKEKQARSRTVVRNRAF